MTLYLLENSFFYKKITQYLKMSITKIQTHNPKVAKHAQLTTTLTLHLFSAGFNTLCTALQSFPNTDITHHTHVTAGDRQRILNTPPTTMTTTKLTMTTAKGMKNGNNNTTSTTSTTRNPGTATNDLIMAQTTQVALFGPFSEFFFSLCFFFTKQYIQLCVFFFYSK